MSAVCLGARPWLVLVLMSRGTPAGWCSGPPLWSLFACVRSCPGGGRLHLSPYFLWKYISFSELAALLAVLVFFCRSCGFWKLCGRVNACLWNQTIYTCARVRQGRSCLAAAVGVWTKESFQKHDVPQSFFFFLIFSFGLEITIKDDRTRVNNSYLWV